MGADVEKQDTNKSSGIEQDTAQDEMEANLNLKQGDTSVVFFLYVVRVLLLCVAKFI